MSGLKFKDFKTAKLVCAVLTSTLGNLFLEIVGRSQLGQGSLQLATIDLHSLPCLIIAEEKIIEKIFKVFEKLCERKILTIYEEIGASSPEGVSLNKVKPDRRELDKIIMGEILGLTEEEQLEVYRAVVDLVRSRLERAKSVQKKKVKELNVDDLVDSVLKELEEVHGIKAKEFPEEYIGRCEYKVVEVPKGSEVEVGYDLRGPYVRIDNEKVRCSSIYEARFIGYAVLAGKTKIMVPKDENILKKAVEERRKFLEEARMKIEEFINETITDKKLREDVKFKAFKKLGM
ncbi:MAG: hypothetical protein B7O98_07015 [Zestosphaera tikiterensis]|uniref:Uncharacterized protein n=1 Tax=Zestosphaera tikiterensis TaxID=1973259 RepID=A0A2R7Y4E7_9CREN|nr:MAG: hypothetical protein B7O98_07015 [Zestosphaera tikiterensis]